MKHNQPTSLYDAQGGPGIMRAARVLCTPVKTVVRYLLIYVATYYSHVPNVTTNHTHSYFSWPKQASEQLTFLFFSTTVDAIRASQSAPIEGYKVVGIWQIWRLENCLAVDCVCFCLWQEKQWQDILSCQDSFCLDIPLSPSAFSNAKCTGKSCNRLDRTKMIQL